MSVLDGISAVLIFAGVAFYIAGSVALLRFPDLFTRLHAVTKADNLGLGLLVLGLILQASTVQAAAKGLLAWLLILFAAAIAGHLIARRALRDRERA